MKMKLVLSIAFSLLTASMLYALEFYDVSRPDIAKIKLNISAKNESALNTVLIQTMERQLKHSMPVSYTHLRAHETRGNLV